MIDSDMSFEGHVVCRLIRCGKPVVAAAYPRRRMDFDAFTAASRDPKLTTADCFALAMDYTLEPASEPGTRRVKVIDRMCRVKHIALGCSVIQRGAFENLIAAGMARSLPDDAVERVGLKGPFYDFFSEIAREDGTMLGEDYSFCKRWHSIAGNEIWALVDESIGQCRRYGLWRALFKSPPSKEGLIDRPPAHGDTLGVRRPYLHPTGPGSDAAWRVQFKAKAKRLAA
jgi:hypothetical protein